MQQTMDDATDYQHGYKNQMLNDVQDQDYIYEEVLLCIEGLSYWLNFRKRKN